MSILVATVQSKKQSTEKIYIVLACHTPQGGGMQVGGDHQSARSAARAFKQALRLEKRQ